MTLAPPIDPLKVTLNKCSECECVGTVEAWSEAWWRERSGRISNTELFPHADYPRSGNLGLDDRMVCPHCGFVHADDDMSAVTEIEGRAHHRKEDRDS